MELEVLKDFVGGITLVEIIGEEIGLSRWKASDNYVRLRKLC